MFTDIAIGGFKYSGKTTVQEYLCKTRSYLSPVFCKQPIVDAFEKYAGHKYNKATDDAALIDFSRTILRRDNPLVVVEYLKVEVPRLHAAGFQLVSADMRFPTENEYFKDNGFLCLKVDASEEVRLARGLARDGTIDNYKPEDDTERFADELFYHYIVSNETSERVLFLQVERVIGRHFPRSRGFQLLTMKQRVRVINESLNCFWQEGTVIGIEPDKATGLYFVKVDEYDMPIEFNLNDLMLVA